MKLDKYLVYIAVAAAHIGLLALVIFAHQRSQGTKPAKPTPPAGVTEVAPVQPSAADGKPAPATPAPARSTTPAPSYQAAGMPGKFHAGFYRRAIKPMSGKLSAMAGECKAVAVVDVDAHTILWEKNSTAVLPIASLTKLVTAQMLLDRIAADPSLTLQTKIKITKNDFARTRLKPLNSVYLGLNEEYTLQEYLKAMIISSANDCAYIVGKFLGGGDLSVFVKEMNTRMAQLGLADMKFINPNGLPVDSGSVRTENMGSALDIAYLAERSLYYPELMKWAGTPADRLRENAKNPFDLNSTNKLLRNKVEGITGLKTGYTATAGHCIAITCKRGQRRIIVVLMGHPGADHGARRDTIARQLLDWAYAPQ